MTARAIAAAVCACAWACTGAEGTIAVSVVTAPGSDLIDQIESARLTLTNPLTVVEAERDSDGTLSLSLDLVAVGTTGFVSIEGFDAAGDLIAFGRSGALPITAVDAEISIYVAAPESISEARVELDPPRSEVGFTRLSFGVMLVGGRDNDGDPIGQLAIYNVYEHDLQFGDPLPEPLASPAVASGEFSFVYIFGGTDSGGDPSSRALRFDTDVAPGGFYSDLVSDAGFARSGATQVSLGSELFVVTGTPALEVDGLAGRAREFSGAPPLDGRGIPLAGSAAFVAGDGAGTTGAVTLRNRAFSELDAPPQILRTGHSLTFMSDGDVLVVGGEIAGVPEASAVRFDPLENVVVLVENFLETPRSNAAITSTGGRIIVAGGTDATGAVVGTVEMFDSEDLSAGPTVPMVVPRTGAIAVPLGNGQALIAGGVDESGQAVGVLELFTPAAE